MGSLDLKDIKVSNWILRISNDDNSNKAFGLFRDIIVSKDNSVNSCCLIVSNPSLFHLKDINNYFLDIYIEKKNGKFIRTFNPDIFRSFGTLYESVLFADLYLRDLGLITLDKINYNPLWEQKI